MRGPIRAASAVLAAGALVGVAVAAPATVPAADAAAYPPIGTGTVLLMDGHRVESTRGLYRQYLRGRKVSVDGLPAGQLFVERVRGYDGADDAADGDTDVDRTRLLDVTTVMLDEGRWRMWLRSGQNVGYRESDDGLHWRVRDPDSVILVKGVNGGSVVKDPISGRYHLIGWSKAEGRYVEMVSTDGLTFAHAAKFSGPLSLLYGDVVAAGSDPVSRSMFAVAKQRTTAGTRCTKSRTTAYSGGRTFGVNVADHGDDDAGHYWRAPRVTLTADCVDVYSVPPTRGTVRPVQLYGAPFQRYGDQFIGFPWLFHITRAATPGGNGGDADGPVDTQIAATPDVTRVPATRPAATVRVGARKARPVAIARGPEGSWDDAMVYGRSLVTEGGISRLYYNGWDTTHDPGIPGRQVRVGAVEWVEDRFAGMRVTRAAGSGLLRTRGFHVPRTGVSRDLRVNAVIPRGETLRVAVLDARTGRMIPGFRGTDSTVIRGDRVNGVVRWRGKRLGALRNRAIKLQFVYGGGTLYSWRVGYFTDPLR